MRVVTQITFIAALVLSIILPFGYYLIGEKNYKRYKRYNRCQRIFLLRRICHCINSDACRSGKCTGCYRR